MFVIKKNALRKVFVSIKGIYYQCEILGQKINYIVPFKYPASLPFDVDYRVMSTFLDFYLVLLKFVNFKLYSSISVQYPPVEVDASNYQGYEYVKINEDVAEDERYKIDEEFKENEGETKNLLFSNLHFYLSTEVPRYSLEYVILAFGGTVDLENNHAGITHVITDRDNITKERTKEYIQPQWIYDSVNFNTLLNVKEYQVGKVPFYLFRLFLPTFLLSSMKTIPRDTSQREKRNSEAFSRRKSQRRRRTLPSRMTINTILSLRTRRRSLKRRRSKRTIPKFQRIS